MQYYVDLNGKKGSLPIGEHFQIILQSTCEERCILYSASVSIFSCISRDPEVYIRI